jgi:mannose-6-phosphate isomerase
LIRGVKPGTTRERFSELLKAGKLGECLNRFEAKPGDVVFIPAGTIHAIGKGVLLAEIQQNSDTTYRVFDWNRKGLDGQLRQLHLDDALNVADFESESPNTVQPGKSDKFNRRVLVQSDKFDIRSWAVSESIDCVVEPERCEVLLVCDGSGLIEYNGGSVEIVKGSCVLLPAALGEYSVKPGNTLTIIWTCPK